MTAFHNEMKSVLNDFFLFYFYNRGGINDIGAHTIYIRNNMGQKCDGNCNLRVLNEIIRKIHPENLKKIVGAVWEIPAK